MDADFVFVGVLTYCQKRRAPYGERHLMYQFEGLSHSFLLSMEGRAQFAGRDSVLTVDSRVTWGPVVTMMPLPLFTLPCVAALCSLCRLDSYPSHSSKSAWPLHGPMRCRPSSVLLIQRCECRCHSM